MHIYGVMALAWGGLGLLTQSLTLPLRYAAPAGHASKPADPSRMPPRVGRGHWGMPPDPPSVPPISHYVGYVPDSPLPQARQ